MTVDINDNTVWLIQKEMARLFDVSIDNIGLHIKNILKDNELDKSTTEESSEVRIEGNRKVRRKVLICWVIFSCKLLKTLLLRTHSSVFNYFTNDYFKYFIVIIIITIARSIINFYISCNEQYY